MLRREFLKLGLFAPLAVVASKFIPSKPESVAALPQTRSLHTKAERDWETGDVKVTTVHRTYALGFRVSQDMLNDDPNMVKIMADDLGDALHSTYRTQIQDVLDDTFGGSLG